MLIEWNIVVVWTYFNNDHANNLLCARPSSSLSLDPHMNGELLTAKLTAILKELILSTINFYLNQPPYESSPD